MRSRKRILPPDAKNPGKNEENRLFVRVLPVNMLVRTISGTKTDTVYHRLWREKTLPPVRKSRFEANKRLFSKNSKKVGKKYIKVVTNGGMWCILNVGLGEPYPEICEKIVLLMDYYAEEESAC